MRWEENGGGGDFMSSSISVIIPNYNHAQFLDRRIRSVLEQTRQPLEVVILDDCSTDESLRVIQRYADHSCVKVVRNQHNSGSPFKQWNLGVRMASGDFIWIAESDDDAEPWLLETLASSLDEDTSAVLSYCQSQTINEFGQSDGTIDRRFDCLSPGRWRTDFKNDGFDECARFLLHFNTIPNASAVLFRRNAYLAAGLADETMRICGDWMMWARISLLGKICYSATTLNKFRIHSGSVCGTETHARAIEEENRVQAFISSFVFAASQTQVFMA